MKDKRKKQTPEEHRAEFRAKRKHDDPTFPTYDKAEHDPLEGTADAYKDRLRIEPDDNPDAVSMSEAEVLGARIANFSASERTMPFSFCGVDSKIIGHLFREALQAQHNKCRGLSFAIAMLKSTMNAQTEGSDAGKMCDNECDVHDDPDDCTGAAEKHLAEMLEQLHDDRVYLKRLSDANNAYVSQIRGFCRRLPPLAIERCKGPKIVPMTSAEIDQLAKDIEQQQTE